MRALSCDRRLSGMSSAEALMGRIETAKGKAAKRAFSQACRLYGKTKPRTLPELRSSTETFVGALQDVLGAELLGDILPLLIDIVPSRDKKRAIGEHMSALGSRHSRASPQVDAASASPACSPTTAQDCASSPSTSRGAFICPSDMTVHASPEALQAHFERICELENTGHTPQKVNAGFICPLDMARFATQEELEAHFERLHSGAHCNEPEITADERHSRTPARKHASPDHASDSRSPHSPWESSPWERAIKGHLVTPQHEADLGTDPECQASSKCPLLIALAAVLSTVGQEL